ncbi:hypothetical protein K469DRAFT_571506 [Zopfia rhizophila CBS 207.26]|uniref:RBR-type E3 ubiquitin transferase n=1 Tax=Zopfia rhizophila CBS 207.26 TaxID=1314779 RepID=A0A6A6E879_9PEZI|nr:hypothetical protein K469DRAFT_571506 [Zopfia rhizophila CBS 207.26]
MSLWVRNKDRRDPLTESNLRQLENNFSASEKKLSVQPPTPLPLLLPIDEGAHYPVSSSVRAAVLRLPTPPPTPLPVLRPATPAQAPPTKIPALPPIKSTPRTPPKKPPSSPPKQPTRAPAKEDGPSYAKFQPRWRICEVCKDTKHVELFSKRPTTTSCAHPPNTCKGCIEKWIESCIENKGWDQCVCPECSEKLTYDDVKHSTTEEVFTRYDSLSTRAALSAIPNFRWCQRPGCPSGQIHNGSAQTNPIFTCSSCSFTYCLNHPAPPYHSGETCAQFDARMACNKPSTHQILQEKASEKKVQETSKRCPNAICGWWIEKNEGCDHMTCWKCQFEFCYLCLVPFEPIRKKGNKYHRQECKYYG